MARQISAVESNLVEIEGLIARYGEGVILDRVHPRIATHSQANARFSTTDPPMATLPADLRDLYMPDEEWPWFGWDWDQQELRLIAAIANDHPLLEAFKNGWDVHTMNACDIFDIPYPIDLKNPHKSPSCAEWRATHGWGGKDDTRRVFSKRFCVPMDTQALTRDGWKTYDQLGVGEQVLTYNQHTGLKEWKPVLKKIAFEDEPVWEMATNQSFKVRSTAEHRWFVKQRTWGGRSWRKPYMTCGVKTTAEINTESNIIVNAPMGPDDGVGTNLNQNKYGTDWVREVCRMSGAQREAFLRGFLLADGCQLGPSKTWHYSQLLGPLEDAVNTASFIQHHGQIYRSVDVPRKMVHGILSHRGHVTGQRLKKTFVGRAPVWCIATENESWVIKQGGCITITGNCYRLNYGGDPRGAGSIPGAKALGLTPTRLVRASHNFLRKHPNLASWRRRTEIETAKTHIVRAFTGRRRVLFAKGKQAVREAFDYPMQAGGAEMLIMTILGLDREFRGVVRYIYSMHDSLALGVHRSIWCPETLVRIADIAERKWNINQHELAIPATFFTRETAASKAEWKRSQP
jgi:hypothetical protein